MRRISVLTLCLLLASSAAFAETKPVKKTSEGDQPQWRIEAKGGVSLLLNAKSFALEHRLRETVRLTAEYVYDEDLHLGVEVIGTGVGNSSYRMIGVYLNAIAPLYTGSVYQLRLLGGWGLGSGPPILSTDLTAESTVALYVQAGLQHRWTIVKDRLTLGIDLLSENLNLVTVTGGVGVLF